MTHFFGWNSSTKVVFDCSSHFLSFYFEISRDFSNKRSACFHLQGAVE